MQHNKYVEHQDMQTYYSKNQFPELQFIGPHNRAHVVCGLRKKYHMCFDPKLGHGT